MRISDWSSGVCSSDLIGLPIHFHTHDTSGIAAASVLAAIESGCDAVDGAHDAMSGLTAQPNLGAIAASLSGSERDPGLELEALQIGRASCGARVGRYCEIPVVAGKDKQKTQ